MMHDIRSLQTHPPPFPLYVLYFHATDEISIAEIIEEWEGHRKPRFTVSSTENNLLEIKVTFSSPFKEEEEFLLDHLYKTIHERLTREDNMGQNN